MDALPNVLVVVLDDVGVDEVSAYGFPDATPMPTLDRLAARGLRFDQAWSAPVCSPSRAALLTGRVALHNGIGAIIFAGREPVELPLDEVTIPEVLDRRGYASAALGKWHVASADTESGIRHPLLQGFDLFAGTPENLHGNENQYDRYQAVGFGGNWHEETRFSTTAIVDDALEALRRLDHHPWFLYVAFHAGHTPLKAPPRELLDGFELDRDDEHSLYQANLVAADHELGRLLEGLGDDLANTLVIVVGDNGCTEESMSKRNLRAPELQGHKGSFLEGGLRVPFVVAGPPVTARGSTQALVHLADVLPTLRDLVDAPDGPAVDGVSLLPVFADRSAKAHDWVYTETRSPQAPPWTNVSRAIRDDTLKVIDAGGETSGVWRIDGWIDTPVKESKLTEAEQRRVAALRAILTERFPESAERRP